MKTTLLISTYNWPEALELVLESAFAQTVLPDEIVIADDGSCEKTRKLIERIKPKSSVPMKHIWHEDCGFRKTIILNKAITISSGDYIMQVDGDCILSRHYVEDHLRMAKPGYFAGGKRVMLTSKETKMAIESKSFQKPSLYHLFSNGKLKERATGIRFKKIMELYNEYVPHSAKPYKGIIGFSISFFRTDFLKINGYDESFIGYGDEDSDILIRFFNSGLRKRVLIGGGYVYHLYHKQRSTQEGSDKTNNHNKELYHLHKREGTTWVPNGVNKYL